MTTGREGALTREEDAVIRALLPAVTAMLKAFDADLLRAERMTHSEFLVLMFLSEAPARTLRLSELAALTQKSLSAVSRAVGRLENDGLVRRVQAAEDGRGFNAVLTDAGLAGLEHARATHAASIRRHLIDHLGDIDLDGLARSLESIASSAGSAPTSRRSSPGR